MNSCIYAIGLHEHHITFPFTPPQWSFLPALSPLPPVHARTRFLALRSTRPSVLVNSSCTPVALETTTTLPLLLNVWLLVYQVKTYLTQSFSSTFLALLEFHITIIISSFGSWFAYISSC